jgi:solute carrier family 25 citrate transporter 1
MLLRKRAALAILLVIAMLGHVAVAVGANRVAVSIFAGAVTGVFETALMYPLENLKTQQQLEHLPFTQLVQLTIRQHGVRGLYSGITPVLIGAIPTQALRWGTFEGYCSVADCSELVHVAIGALLAAVVVTVFVGVPIETLKTERIHAMSPTIQLRAREEGWEADSKLSDADPRGGKANWCRFRGWLPTIMKKLTNQVIRFPVHSVVMKALCKQFVLGARSSCKGSSHPIIGFFAGAIAGMSSIFATQPFDVVKTRMQGLQGHRFRNSWHCLTTIIAHEGLSVLASGLWPRTVKSALGAGLTFSIFPVVQEWMRRATGAF